MKKILPILLLFVSVFTTYGQKVVINEIDKFTKNKIIQVNAMKYKNWETSDAISKGMLKHVYLSFKAINEYNYLQFGVSANGYTRCLSQGDLAILLFSDDSTLELKNTKETNCDHTSVTGMYPITSEELEILNKKELKEFRIYFSDGYIDYEVRKNKEQIIKETINLFLETIKKDRN